MDTHAFDGNQEKLERYFRNPTPELRNEIVMDNQELVWFTVKKYTSGIATRDDMFQAGMVGLIIAIERFKPEKGVRLSTYAVPYIQNEIRHLIDNPDYLEDHAEIAPVDDLPDTTFRQHLDRLYTAVLTSEERLVLDIVLRTSGEPAWSIHDIALQTGFTSKRVKELYASGIQKLNEPWVRWYIKQVKEIV